MKKLRLLGICLLVLVSLGSGTAAELSTDSLHVSLPDLQMRSDESIQSFKCEVIGGRIVAVSRVPEMWSFTITNGDGGVSSVKARALVGAAEFRTADLAYFKDFLVVERHNPPSQYDRAFDITVTVVLDSDREGVPKRKLTITRKDLALSAVGRAANASQ